MPLIFHASSTPGTGKQFPTTSYRGILVGSRIESAKLSDDYPVPFYKKHCHYLFFTGVQQVWTSSESTKEAAEKSSCAALKREPVIHRRHKPSDF